MATNKLSTVCKIIEIAANLTDPVYQGTYYGKTVHTPDIINVIQRAKNVGVTKIMVTGGSLTESSLALNMCQLDSSLYSTVGCHPTRCTEFENCTDGPAGYLNKLKELAISGMSTSKVIAFGEVGLDFDRLEFCSKEVQLKHYEPQIQLACELKLPLFLHCRNSFSEFYPIMKKYAHNICGGVVHSYTGTLEEALAFIELGLHIGINGCSMKTEENLRVIAGIPIEKIMVETDAPWCDIKQTHASFRFVKTSVKSVKKEKWSENFLVKSRNEPCRIIEVLEVISGIKNIPLNEVIDQTYENTCGVFFKSELK